MKDEIIKIMTRRQKTREFVKFGICMRERERERNLNVMVGCFSGAAAI